MRNINFNTVLTDMERAPIRDGQLLPVRLDNGMVVMPEDNRKLLTLGLACANAIMTPQQADGQLTIDEHLYRYTLAIKVRSNMAGDLESKDVAFMIERLRLFGYGPLIVAQCYGLLEEKPMPAFPRDVDVEQPDAVTSASEADN